MTIGVVSGVSSPFTNQDSKMIESAFSQFVGNKYEFGDGASIKIVQIKLRDAGFLITYETCYPSALPRRLVMSEQEFINTFGHLFT